MAHVLAHRGPDGEGFYIGEGVGFAHRRLSIVDIATGQQPLANEDGTVWVAFNGEIYNFASLRVILEGRGHRFRTHSDTEVIVHSYEEWGDHCVDRLSQRACLRSRCGIIATPACSSRVIASGIEPLYYAQR